MKTASPIFFFVLIAALGACGNIKKKFVIPYADLSAPVMPVWLTGDTAQLPKADIFPGKKVGIFTDVTGKNSGMGASQLTVIASDNTPDLKIIFPKSGNNRVLFGLPLLNESDKTRCDLILKKQVQIPVTFTYRGKCEKSVFVKGDFNAWNAKSDVLQKVSDSVYTTTLLLDPGEYGYQGLQVRRA